MRFKRETATDAADLPHRYEDSGNSCGLCGFTHNDPRHVAWERADLLNREQAQAEFKRETGS